MPGFPFRGLKLPIVCFGSESNDPLPCLRREIDRVSSISETETSAVGVFHRVVDHLLSCFMSASYLRSTGQCHTT